MSKKKKCRMPEPVRKFIVSLKRRPNNIPLVILIIAFIYYSLNLTHVSHTTARIQGPGMGLFGFVTMLFSVLALVCMNNAFPKRKKVNKPMLGLMFAMNILVMICDIRYRTLINVAIHRANNPIKVEFYIARAYNMLLYHTYILGIGLALVVLLPVYSRLLKKINTSIEVEGNEDMGEIELSSDEE